MSGFYKLLCCSDSVTHIISRSVTEYIVKCFFLGNVFRCFSDDNGQLYFVIRDVFRDRLGSAGNDYGRTWADDGRWWLIEQYRGAAKNGDQI